MDKGDRELTLRPRGRRRSCAPTSSTARARAAAREALYFAPMFRYAKGQRGRYREHWQFGVESLARTIPPSTPR